MATWRPNPFDTAVALAAAAVVVGENAAWGRSGYGLPAGLLAAVATASAAGVFVAGLAPQHAVAPAAVAIALPPVAASQHSTQLLLSCVATLAALAWRAGSNIRARWTAIIAFAVVAAGAALAALAIGRPSAGFFPAVVLALFGILPWLVGRYRAQERALMTATHEQVHRLEREREFIAERTRLRERTRLAEEMHDSLGHELSLLALRAGDLELTDGLPPAVQSAVSELRAGIGAATARLAQIIAVLHDETEPASTTPANPSIAALVNRARAAGMTVELATTDDPPPIPVAQAVHRIVQEALTNAAKHAPGAAVEVTITTTSAGTVVTVRNDRPAAEPVAQEGGLGGRGLIGLTERVRLLGGELTTSQLAGGFALTAHVPHDQLPKDRP